MPKRGFVRDWRTSDEGKPARRGISSRSSKLNMAYLVKISSRAQRDLSQIYRRINAAGSDAALKWYRGLKVAILGLENQPGRCPVTPENKQLRHLLYGHKPHIYRVICSMVEKRRQVDVLHIRHGARQ